MKKVCKKLLCTGACFLGLVGSVNAATIAVGNDSTAPGAANKSVSIELKDDDLIDYTEIEFQLSVSGTSYAEITFDVKPIGGLAYETSTDGTTYTIKGSNGGNLFATSIGSVSYKTTENLAGDFKIVPTNVKFKKADGTVLKPGDAGIKVQEGTIKYEKIKSTEATLKSLTVSQGALSPEFDKTVTEYTVKVKDTINSIRINADACDGATRAGTGNKTLAMGENLFEIEVTAEDGVTKNTYTVRVIRGEIAEPSAFLKSLLVNNIGVSLSPEFDSKNNKYTVNIPKNISKLDFKYELEDPLAEVTIEGNENFTEGENLVTIKVVSSDTAETQIYEITVIKEEKESEEIVPPTEEKKEEEKKESKLWLIILIAIIIIGTIVGVAFLLFHKKKNKKDGLPLKKTENKEKAPTITVREDKEFKRSEDSSITQILKDELFDDNDKTQRFDSSLLKEQDYEEDDIYKTKEFDFKNFE